MAIIEEISIKNYRVLQNVTLKGIQSFSVFLDPNGSYCGNIGCLWGNDIATTVG